MMSKLTAVFLRRTFSSERQILASDTGEIERYFVARNDFLRGMLLIDYDTHITNEMFLTEFCFHSLLGIFRKSD